MKTTTSGLHVAITGASSGLGEALAREFSRAGAKVTLVARRRQELERIARELPGESFVAPHDLSDPTRAADWISDAEAALGPIDVLISNAGFLTLGPVSSFDPDEGERMINVNMLTPARLIRALLPAMIARGHGTIVNVTSVAAFVSIPGWAYQAASKAGSATFSEALSAEVAGTGVHVMTAYPGMTDTPMTQAGLDVYGRKGLVSRIPLGDAVTFARRLRAAVERRKKRFIYPGFYAFARWFPGIARWFAASQRTAMDPHRKPRLQSPGCDA
jgi:short-subunit dehydrogenase